MVSIQTESEIGHNRSIATVLEFDRRGGQNQGAIVPTGVGYLLLKEV